MAVFHRAPEVPLGGHAEHGFGGVADVFRKNFTERDEVGAAVCVKIDGKTVVDLWGGTTQRGSDQPWTADTLSILFSASKGVSALALMHLADRGGIDLDAPVITYWDGFGRNGKEDITVRTLINHRGGLVGIDKRITLDALEKWDSGEDPSMVVEALEQQRPMWKPGTAQGYHALSWGLYVAEVFRRASGQRVGAYLREHLADPLGAEVWLGLPASEEGRVASLHTNGPKTLLTKIIPRVVASKQVEGRLYRSFLNPKSATRKAFSNPADLGLRGVENYGTRRIRKMDLPFASGVGTARGLATLYSAFAAPNPLDPIVSSSMVEAVSERQSWGWDRVLRKPMGFSQGFVKDELHLFSPVPETFGHPGAGGTLGFADPVNGIGFGYLMNRMDFRLRSPRAMELARAVYRALR
jgi:CubicO group peptidase (beta-lactamase class C family)